MSENFEMLVDVDATIEEAHDISCSVLDDFRKRGIIVGEANDDCVLGGSGYLPGPAIPGFYERHGDEEGFWELRTCGVEPRVGRGFNEWALGPVCEWFRCPLCNVEIKTPFEDSFWDILAPAIGLWTDQSGPPFLRCPKCDKNPLLTEWQCKPPLGFGNLAFRFWNWPPFDSSSWKIDIPAIVRETTGHNIVLTYGHI